MSDLAADFKAPSKISLAGAFAAALAKEMKADPVTGDPEFKSLEKEIKIAWLKESASRMEPDDFYAEHVIVRVGSCSCASGRVRWFWDGPWEPGRSDNLRIQRRAGAGRQGISDIAR